MVGASSRWAWAVFLCALALYALTASGHLYSPDEEVMFRTTQSIFEDGDLTIAPIAGGFATARSADGREYAQYGVGQPLLAVPFYAAGRLLAPTASIETWRRLYGLSPRDDASLLFEPTREALAARFTVSFFNIFVAAALVAVFYLLALELTADRRAALWTTALLAVGTLIWAHSRPFFSETCAVFFMVLAWYFVVRSLRGDITRWMILAGAAAGYAALVRMDSVLLYPGLAMAMLGPVRRATGKQAPKIHPYAAFCSPALICGAVLLILNAVHFGGPFATGYSDQPEGVQFSTPLLAGLYGLLFSVGKGLFFFSPALVLNFAGWKPFAKTRPWMAAGVALSIVLPLIVMAKWQNWAGGWSWGPRHIVMVHPFLALPIACWIHAAWNPLRRATAVVLLVAGMAVQMLGCSQDFMEFHTRYFRYDDSGRYYRVLYDAFDAGYWARYYELYRRDPASGMRAQVSLQHAPAPIQDSLWLPQVSVWSGYPRMWRETRSIDNLWFRLANAP